MKHKLILALAISFVITACGKHEEQTATAPSVEEPTAMCATFPCYEQYLFCLQPAVVSKHAEKEIEKCEKGFSKCEGVRN